MEEALQIAANLAETMSHFARTEPASIVRDVDGVRIVDVGQDLRVFNTAVITAATPDEEALRARIALVRRHFAARQSSWSLWLCEGLLPTGLSRRLPRLVREFGLSRNSVTPGMIASSLVPGRAPAGLEIRRIADAPARASFCRILSRIFEGPSHQLTAMYQREALWSQDFRGYVGSVNGWDVCAGFAVAAGGTLGIYALATLPEFTRRGYASALIRHAADESRAIDGELPLVLQATETGQRLYARLGFHSVTEFTLYCSG
jgi:ribosomal protein S18 acetylase RimI-like enzyme